MAPNQETALTRQPEFNQLRTMLEGARPALASVLPKHLTADRLIRIALSATSRSPLLLRCTPKSILLSVMQAAQCGLEVGGALGHAYLVPFKNSRKVNGQWLEVYEATFIPGYRGLIDLARRSGHLTFIEAHVVHKGDDFKFALGLTPKLAHVPGDGTELTHAYAIARTRGADARMRGMEVLDPFEVMTRAQIEAVRASSKAGVATDRNPNPPWVTHYDEMARKTVVKRLCKYLPLSVEMSAAIEADNRVETGASSGFSEILDIEMPGDDEDAAEVEGAPKAPPPPASKPSAPIPKPGPPPPAQAPPAPRPSPSSPPPAAKGEQLSMPAAAPAPGATANLADQAQASVAAAGVDATTPPPASSPVPPPALAPAPTSTAPTQAAAPSDPDDPFNDPSVDIVTRMYGDPGNIEAEWPAIANLSRKRGPDNRPSPYEYASGVYMQLKKQRTAKPQ